MDGQSKQAKAREIIAYCERTGLTGELIVSIRKQRPKLVLHNLYSAPPVLYHQQPKKQLSKIATFFREFDLLTDISSEDQAQEVLRRSARLIHTLLSYAFLDTCEISTVHDFIFLHSLNIVTGQDHSRIVRVGLICHITPFVSTFEELVSTYFDKADQEYLERTLSYPEDLNIKINYKWADNIPYRIIRTGPKAIRIDCLDSSFFTVKFPLQTSDLLVLFSAMINGRGVLYDDIDFSSLQPNEVKFLNYTEEAKRYGLDLSDFSINVSEPESWNVITKRYSETIG
ncbi:MAG: hypothetical protein HND44_09290 [Chloroflexi bacterium]|nr:hypothetical protein [Ardenticatenaceae bacterium]MBL1128673.1 hypothetical protein [Chloroflexota bacterium]NOG34752.1 hypothetical protein [Chloroflexota bacterium]GIK57569.1 MAG: hypothetical protein BroJett015_32320 [Chloroflexota bacterium]